MAITRAAAQAMVDAIDTAISAAVVDGWATLSVDGQSGTRYSLSDLTALRKHYSALANRADPDTQSPLVRTHLRLNRMG